jgi:alpha-D-ribose 1-methylphosphonate 5-triphosphate synthase subunit PhnH
VEMDAVSTAVMPAGAAAAVARASGDDSWRVFEAIFYPGRVLSLTHVASRPPLHAASLAACRALMNDATPLWLDAADADEVVCYLERCYGIPAAVDPRQAAFAIVTQPLATPALHRFRQGSREHPERSTTLIIQVPRLVAGTGRRLKGPGLETETRLQVDGLSASFWTQLQNSRIRYPCGFDVIFTCGRRLAALPRWTEVEA